MGLCAHPVVCQASIEVSKLEPLSFIELTNLSTSGPFPCSMCLKDPEPGKGGLPYHVRGGLSISPPI